MTGNVVVYTAICGGYDRLKATVAQSIDCDWLAFSDAPLAEDAGWQVRALANPEE